MEVLFDEDPRGHRPVQEFIDRLTHKTEINQVVAHVRELKSQGYRLQRPLAAPLRSGVYELRPGQNRILYAYVGGAVVLLHAFRKKTMIVPDREIELALGRLEQWRKR
jgi:phage-related protein